VNAFSNTDNWGTVHRAFFRARWRGAGHPADGRDQAALATLYRNGESQLDGDGHERNDGGDDGRDEELQGTCETARSERRRFAENLLREGIDTMLAATSRPARRSCPITPRQRLASKSLAKQPVPRQEPDARYQPERQSAGVCFSRRPSPPLRRHMQLDADLLLHVADNTEEIAHGGGLPAFASVRFELQGMPFVSSVI
jgi:hypothetical protein